MKQGQEWVPDELRARARNHPGRYRNFLRVAASLLLLAPFFATAGPAAYIYDSAHRVSGVVNGSGALTRYVYDDVGNLVRTDTIAAGQLALLTFSPEHGAVGTPVSIFGQGFAATAGANTVKFNGTAATVSSVTANQLQVSVPVGATSGAISVTTSAGTVSSATPFTVDGTGLAPTITSVSPVGGAAGTLVTITGTHLDPVSGATSITLNSVPVTPTTVTDTTVTFPVPAVFGGGRFLVSTPYGQATAPTDFTTTEPDYRSGYTIVRGRLAVDGTATALSLSGSKVGHLLMDAAPGDWISLQAPTPGSSFDVSLELFDPRGIRIGAVTFMNQSHPTDHLLQLSVGGTYTVTVLPSGSQSFNLAAVHDHVLAPDTPVSFVTTTKGAGNRYLYKVGPGQSFNLGVPALTSSISGDGIYIQGGDANGTFYSRSYCGFGNGIMSCSYAIPGFVLDDTLASLPPAGWRQLLVDSEVGSTSTATLQLEPDVVTTATPGTTNAVSLPKVGQATEQLFAVTAGQYYSINVQSLVTQPSATWLNLEAYDPDGNRIFRDGTTSSGFYNLPKLTKAGNYRLYLYTDNGATSSFSDTLLADPLVNATPNGSPVTASIPMANEASYVTFSVTAGQSYTVQCTATGYADTEVDDSQGNRVGSSGYCGNPGGDIVITAVPASDVYTIKLSGSSQALSPSVKVTSP